MPPPAAAEVAVAQLVVLVVLLLVLPVLLPLELDELPQAAVSSRPLATAAVAAITCLARTIPSQAQSPGTRDARSQILARQVEIMTSQQKREVSSPWRPGIRYWSDW
jgi:hypothetical protein